MAAKTRFDALVNQVRIGQFVSVGAAGAVIETILVAIMTTVVGMGPLLAKAVGAESSISTMFLINDQWTFADEGKIGFMAILQRWGKSHIVRTGGLFLSFSILYLLTSGTQFSLRMAGIDFWPTVANIIGIGLGMGVNYVAECLFTWRVA